MPKNRTIEKMLSIEDDIPVLVRVCEQALCEPDPENGLYRLLVSYGLGSRREVHFCRGYMAASLGRVYARTA